MVDAIAGVSSPNNRLVNDWAQDQLAALSTNVVHRVVNATHHGLLEDQGPSRASEAAIDAVITAVRRGTEVSDR